MDSIVIRGYFFKVPFLIRNPWCHLFVRLTDEQIFIHIGTINGSTKRSYKGSVFFPFEVAYNKKQLGDSRKLTLEI